MTLILGNPRWQENYGADAMALVLTKPPQMTGKLTVFPNINLIYQVPLKTCHSPKSGMCCQLLALPIQGGACSTQCHPLALQTQVRSCSCCHCIGKLHNRQPTEQEKDEPSGGCESMDWLGDMMISNATSTSPCVGQSRQGCTVRKPLSKNERCRRELLRPFCLRKRINRG
jgi:hypothetical protein